MGPVTRVVHVASGREWRGGQRQVLILAAGLQRANAIESIVITGKGTAMAARLAAAGVRTVAAPWGPGIDPRAAMYAVSVLQPGSVLHAHDSHSHALADAVSRIRGTPVVVTRRVMVPIRNARRYSRANAVIAISSSIRTLLLDAGVAADRIHVVPDAVDVPHVTTPRAWPDDIKPVTPGAPLIVAIAALTREKGVNVLLDAAALLHAERPDARWIVLGEGTERAALDAQRAALGLNEVVDLAGFVGIPEAVLQRATIVVQPSLSEGLGSSVLDALALGIPVVASRTGGLPEALAHGGGLLVTPGSAAELSAAVAHLINDAADRQRIGTEGIRASQHFSVDRLVRGTLDVYRSVGQQPGFQ